MPGEQRQERSRSQNDESRKSFQRGGFSGVPSTMQALPSRQKARARAALLSLSALGFASSALAQQGPTFRERVEAQQHRQVLTERVDELLNGQVADEVMGTIEVAAGSLGIMEGVQRWRDEPNLALSYVVGFGLIDGAVAASLFMPRDTRSAVLETVLYAGPFVATLGPALAQDPSPLPRLSAGALAAGYFSGAVLSAVNRSLTPTRFSTLRRHHARLAEAGRELTEAERRRLHRDLLGARGPIPRWMVGLPLLAAGAVALTPAFNASYGDQQRTFAAITGGVSLLGGLCSFVGSPVDNYESDLKSLEITVAAAPGGLTMHGVFSGL
jgi:hypothetical protein